jgi:4-amino-4-deoxy-L-arabinose transferase-like glycosyltransferase
VTLFLGTVLSRIPFRSQILYHWDSVNFAFAMQRFDVAAEQPQPPGYIVYVWLCRLVNLLFHDPQATMLWISMVGSGLAVVVMYLLGRAMFDRRTGLVGALFLATSPLFWFYGEIALPHTLDTFLVILSVWLLWEVMQGWTWAVVPAAVSVAVAGGVRQQTLVFLGLATLCATVGFLRRVGWARGLRWGTLAIAICGLLCAGWFFPLINSTGGLDSYLQVMGDFSARFNATTSLFMGAGSFGLTRNLRKLSMYTAFGWSVALVPLVLYALQRVWQRRFRVRGERALFMLAWMLPPLLFYTIIHMGQQGLVFVFLPALLLVSALATVRLLGGQGQRALAAGIAALALINAALFIALPEYPLGGEQIKVLSWNTLRNNDAYYQERFDAIREHFPAESTAILAANWRHVQWYLPEYVRLPFDVVAKWEKDEGNPKVDPQEIVVTPKELGLQLDGQGQVALVVFDPYLMAFSENPTTAHELSLTPGAVLEYFILAENQAFHYGAGSFGIRDH